MSGVTPQNGMKDDYIYLGLGKFQICEKGDLGIKGFSTSVRPAFFIGISHYCGLYSTVVKANGS